MRTKKGVSPVVATVLLIAMVVVLGLIIFLWFRGFTQEAVTKFDTNIELVCNDATFDASYVAGVLSIINTGNVPIYKMNLKSFGMGSYTTKSLSEGWPEMGLNQGDSFSKKITLENNPEEITITPVLMGNSKRGGKKSFTCNEDQYGFLITL